MTELSDTLHSWKASGHFRRVDDVDLWYLTRGRGPWLVCFHGFPTSSWDWHRVLPQLARNHRVLLFDFPGFGLSEKPPGRDYSLLRQTDAAEALLQSLGIAEFDLLAHDMGNTVACEWLYRLQEQTTSLKPRSVSFLNGGFYPELHQPLPTQRLLRTPVLGEVTARLASYALFRQQFPQVYAKPGDFDEQHYRDQWSLILHGGGRRVLASLAGYMNERLRYKARWLGPLEQLSLPATMIWGMRDPIAVPAIARRLAHNNPAIGLLELEDTGHYPQLENPQAVVNALDTFWHDLSSRSEPSVV